MRPANLKTKIFLDSGDPKETRETIKILGYLDGQTTNPTLISKNPKAKEKLDKGEKFTKEEILNFYKQIVTEISGLIPNGSVSVEVYADQGTKAVGMFKQGREMFSWVPNAYIKFPTTQEGLKAAEQSVKEGMRVNMTLCFSQEQAAAVYTATQGAKKGDVFVSPFIGRLDDKGENGMNLIENIVRMYKTSDRHVEVLTASVRNMDHFLYAIKLGSDIITAPFKVLKEWADKNLIMPDFDFVYNVPSLKAIFYQEIDLKKSWQEYNITNELTNVGIKKFSTDWNQILK